MPQHGEIDDALKEVLLTATSQDVERRYGSVQDLYAALAAYLESIWPGRTWR